jgi:hypothetical protein
VRALRIELILRHSSSETVNALPRKDSSLVKEVKLRILKERVFDNEISSEISKFNSDVPEAQVIITSFY